MKGAQWKGIGHAAAAKERQQRPLLQRVGGRLRRWWRAVAPGPRAWRGAAWGSLGALASILLVTAYSLFAPAGMVRFAIGTLLLLAAIALLGALATLFWRVLKGIPALFIWVLSCTVAVFALLGLFVLPVIFGLLAFIFGMVGLAALLGAGLAALAGGRWRQGGWLRRLMAAGGLVVGLVGLVLGTAWLLDDGSPAAITPHTAMDAGTLTMPNPSLAGPYSVKVLYYGSGQNRRRVEYGRGAQLITRPVDGSAMVERWSALRTRYWGFGPQALPLNGRVWYPQGAGPFPLVLIAHGNHAMEDFSDAGYAYLGELLASRGFIVASVDQNFLNLSPFADGLIVRSLKEENDLRAWLLLEHLRLWRAWNGMPSNPFSGKVDLDNVALIGHSRGGEAVAVAAAFNRLAYYPDDATVPFDYGFNIRSLVAIAPVDGQYRPAGRGTALVDVNYLVLHGAHDMDVVSFAGARQYARVRFTQRGDWFKAALYIDGANHGQFNTAWGRKDMFEPLMRIFNLGQLMPADEQRQIAKVYISAFLETTLRAERDYRPLFRDHRRGRAWLPQTRYLSQYEDAATRLVSTYEEDINVETTTLPGGVQAGENLAIWREQLVEAKWGDMDNHAVHLGWDANDMPAAAYTIRLPQGRLLLSRRSVLVFSLADAREDLAARAAKGWRTGAAASTDLTVEVVDRAGQRARLPLSHVAVLPPPLQAQLGKAAFMSPLPTWEVVFQHFEFPLADFVAANPEFGPADLVEVCFVFDRSGEGAVFLDDIGFRE